MQIIELNKIGGIRKLYDNIQISQKMEHMKDF